MTPLNKSLYNNVKNKAKRIFKVWPSAYASGWLTKEYKRLGGKYKNDSRSRSRYRSKSSGLSRWYAEKWIDVCKLPKKVPCGRKKSSMKNYPYCRPSIRISPKSPRIASEFTKSELKRRCSKKHKSPKKRIY